MRPCPRPPKSFAPLSLVLGLALSACGGGDAEPPAISNPAPVPAPSPAPTPAPAPAPTPAPPPPAPAPSACGSRPELTLAALAPFAGSYAVEVFNADAVKLGPAGLVLSGSSLQFTPGSGLSGSSAATASVTAVCENKDSGGNRIGVVAVIDAERHVDFFSPAFNGLYVAGTDLGSAAASGRYLQGRLAKDVPAPAPAPAPTPIPPGALTSYEAFSAAAPATRQIAPSGALAWLAGSYYGRSSAGLCSVNIRADGVVSASMNGVTQSAALDGEAGDTWFQQPSNSMAFAVNVVAPGKVVILTGYAGRLTLVEMGGVLDKCAIAFKSDSALSMDTVAAPLPLKSSGLSAAELPAWLIGTWRGHGAGTLLAPRTATTACTLIVSADGSALLQSGERSYSAQFTGGSVNNDRDASEAGRASVYAALTGARNWVWLATAQSPSGSSVAQVQIEIAHTGERSQVSFAQGQIGAGGLSTQAEACYFPN